MVAQTEKRLALVIGNSDYEFTTKLKNPVNDALLIAKTLEELEFDVILGTNLVDEDAFFDKIEEFAEMRPDYDVAFVFYAGHGSQIENQNYLLPTGINAKTERDVKYKAVSVQMIMDVLTGMTDEVNVLILDACRDNNFEKNWNEKTRSASGKGSGLAKMKAPSGSLIAFSTTAGTTAPDGEGMNSDYTRVLAEQMKVPGISLDQVFRNVRRELLEISNGNQQTEEATQLTGDEAFYLVKSTYEKEFDYIDSLIVNDEYITAIQVISKVITLDPKNKRAYKYQGDIYYKWKKYDKSLESYNHAITLDDEYIAAYYNRPLVFEDIWEYNNALKDYNKILSIDSMRADVYNRRGIVYHFYLDDFEKGLDDYNTAISLDPSFGKVYINRGKLFTDLKKYNKALDDFNFGISLAQDKNNITYKSQHIAYENRADYYLELEDFESALIDYNTAIKIKPTYFKVYGKRADLYQQKEDYTNALIDYTKAIDLDSKNPERYINRAYCYNLNKQHELALNDYNTVIRMKDDYFWYYYMRAYTNSVYLYKHEEAIIDFTKSIELDSTFLGSFRDRADAYQKLGNTKLAIADIKKAIKLKPSTYMYNALANIYWFDLNDSENALLSYQSAIMIDSTDIYPYINRINIYEELEEHKKVLADLNTLISLDPNNEEYYLERADYFNYQGSYDSALVDYSKVLELTSDDYSKSRAINNRALIYGYQGDIELEIEEYSRALEIKKDATWYSNRGAAYEQLEQFDEALLDYNQMTLLEPDISEVWNTRGLFYHRQLDYKSAINDFNQSLKIDENEPYINYYISNLYYDIGEYKKAIKHSTKAINIFKSSDVLRQNEKNELAEMLARRALTYTSMGEIKKAINDCNESIEIDSTNITTYYGLAYAYLRLDDYKSSFTTCDKAINNSERGEVFFYMIKGVIYFRMNEIDSAYSLFYRALEINEYPHIPVIIYDILAKLSIHTQNYDKAIDYCMKAIENNEKDLNAYNNLSIIYEYQNKPFKAIIKLTKIIEQVSINELIAPNKDDILFNDYDENESTLSLADLYIKRGKLWKIIKDDKEMCEDYQKACELGDCELFNTNCK